MAIEENAVELLHKEKLAANNNNNNDEVYHRTVVQKKEISSLRRLTPQVNFCKQNAWNEYKNLTKLVIFFVRIFVLGYCCCHKEFDYCE